VAVLRREVGMGFPVSSFEPSLLALPLVSLAISFFTSMAGISGAFLLLPFQVSVLGFTSPSVSATNHLYNILATPSGVVRYAKEGRMLWPLAGMLAVGTVPGALIGAYLRVRYLPDPARFKLFAGVVLLYAGGRMLADRLRGRGRQNRGDEHGLPARGVLGLSLLVGLVGGTYGIGGGSIIAPLLVSWLRLPVERVAGAALAATGMTSLVAVAAYQTIALLEGSPSIAPDWTVGLLFGLGGMVGMSLGARCQGRVPGRTLEWLMGLILISVALGYIFGSLPSASPDRS
jgi:uncharacterized membrane protein YfcA